MSDEERARIAELAATRLPSRLIAKEVGRSHRAVWSYFVKLRDAGQIGIPVTAGGRLAGSWHEGCAPPFTRAFTSPSPDAG